MNDTIDLKVVCAWCKVHMRGDVNNTNVSHGICKVCFNKVVAAL